MIIHLRPWSSWYTRPLQFRTGATQKLVVPLPEWWPSFEVPHRRYVPLPAVATYLEEHLARDHPHAWLCLRSGWVFNVASRWVTNISHRGIMWRLSPSVCNAIENLGIEFLCEGTSVEEEELTRWLGLCKQLDWSAFHHQLYIERDRRVEWRPATVMHMSRDLFAVLLRGSLVYEDTFNPKSATWWDLGRRYEAPAHLEHFSGFPSKSEMLRRGVLTVGHSKPHKSDAAVHDCRGGVTPGIRTRRLKGRLRPSAKMS